MTQEERRLYLINELIKENSRYSDIVIPNNEVEQKALLRGLMNVRMPNEISKEFLKIQDEYLKEECKQLIQIIGKETKKDQKRTKIIITAIIIISVLWTLVSLIITNI